MKTYVFHSNYKGRPVKVNIEYDEERKGFAMQVIDLAITHKPAFFHPYYSDRDRLMAAPYVTNDLTYYQKKLDDLGVAYPESFQLVLKHQQAIGN